jgi:CHAD domain-containing protein
VARVARGRLDHALDELRGDTDSSAEEAVHEARKDIKKLRALLRLVRDEIGDEIRREENDALRATAGRLSGVRDADVMIETLESLPLGKVTPAAYDRLHAALAKHRRELEGGGRESAVSDAVADLEEARARVEGWPLEHDSWDSLEPGLRRSYRRGRRAYRAARKEPATEQLHEWRKRAKDLWYHLTLLRDAWAEPLKAAGDEAHELSDRLGEDHDLAVLQDFVRSRSEVLGSAAAFAAFDAAVERRRRELQLEAFALGERLYAESPKAFVSRMGALWKAWRDPLDVGLERTISG